MNLSAILTSEIEALSESDLFCYFNQEQHTASRTILEVGLRVGWTPDIWRV